MLISTYIQWDKHNKVDGNDDKNKKHTWPLAFCLLEKLLTRENRE
jgi:hypothetical protein